MAQASELGLLSAQAHEPYAQAHTRLSRPPLPLQMWSPARPRSNNNDRPAEPQKPVDDRASKTASRRRAVSRWQQSRSLPRYLRLPRISPQTRIRRLQTPCKRSRRSGSQRRARAGSCCWGLAAARSALSRVPLSSPDAHPGAIEKSLPCAESSHPFASAFVFSSGLRSRHRNGDDACAAVGQTVTRGLGSA